MRIAISFSGDGQGHATRMGALTRTLSKKHELIAWCPQKVRPFFRKIVPGIPVKTLPLLSLVKRRHKVDIFQTAMQNARVILGSRRLIKQLTKELKTSKVDAVISDYEPFLPKAARNAGIPVLLFNHQGIVDKIPGNTFSAFAARTANRIMMPPHDKLIVSSFYKGDVGPLLREEVIKAKRSEKDFIVVYVKASYKEILMPMLRGLGENFRFFPDKNSDFVSALASCKAVIAPAGHQLISECLALGKPVLAIPEKNQYEQQLNAMMLEKSGMGMKSSIKDLPEAIPRFLKGLGRFSKPRGAMYCLKDDTANAARKVERFLKIR